MRDYSINKLYNDPVADRVPDLIGGVEHIRNKVLRVNNSPHEYIHNDLPHRPLT